MITTTFILYQRPNQFTQLKLILLVQLIVLVAFYKVEQFRKTSMVLLIQATLDYMVMLLQKLRQRCLLAKRFRSLEVMLMQISTKWTKLVIDVLILTMQAYSGHIVVFLLNKSTTTTILDKNLLLVLIEVLLTMVLNGLLH